MILEKFSLSGADVESFKKSRKEFEDSTQVFLINLSACEMFHVDNKKTKESKKYIALQKVNEELIASINHNIKNDSVYEYGAIQKEKTPPELLQRIYDGDIHTAIRYGGPNGQVFFLDQNVISMIASKCGIKSKTLYDGTRLADTFLFIAMQSYEGLLTAITREFVSDAYSARLLVAMFSDKFTAPSIVDLPEFDDKLLNLSNYKITQYNTIVELEGKAIGNFIPVIRISSSDTGKGIFKKQLCVRSISSKRSVIIRDIEEAETTKDVLSDFKKIANKDNANVIGDTGSIFYHDKGIKSALGVKRVKNLQRLFEDMTEEEFLLTLLSVPDKAGRINETSDMELETAIGSLFSTGICVK